MRRFHRRDGKVVKVGDDLLAATRYALMMLRFAQVPSGWASNEPLRRGLRVV
jgi:hypothetical protein